MQNIEKKTAKTFIYGIGNIEVEILQIGGKDWLKEIALFVEQGADSFTVIAIQKPELKNPLFLSRAIQAFITHLQCGGEHQKSGQIRNHFRNWLYKQNGSLKDIINGKQTCNPEQDRQSNREELKSAFERRYSGRG